jgi:hypothetical protein
LFEKENGRGGKDEYAQGRKFESKTKGCEKMTYVTTLNQFVNRRMYDTSKAVEYAEFGALTAIAVLVPLLLGQPQLLVGSAVNFMLIMAAINVRGWKKILPLIVLPSVAAVAGGFLFGPFTIFLVYMVPFIWVGNAILVFVFKYLYVTKGKNYAITLLIAAGLKAGFLFATALLLINLSILPLIFAMAMGVMQIVTAIVGGFLVFPVNLAYHKYFQVSGSA